MKLKEVCKAFAEGNELVSECGIRYKISPDGVSFLCCESSVWEKADYQYPFEHPGEMSICEEYNLTFFEAMRKADEGWIVSNDDWSKPEYVVHDGIPCYFGDEEITACFTKNELQAKWKVVRKVEE